MNFLYKNDLPSDIANQLLSGSIAIDTEAMGLRIIRDRLCLVQLSSGNGDAHLVKFDGSDYSAPNLRNLLGDENVLKIFHYARFDLSIMQHYLKIRIKNVYCTKIASRLVRTYSDSHGLKSLCDELLGVELSKRQQSSNWGAATLTDDQIKYAASDVLYLHRLKVVLDRMLESEKRADLARNCFLFLEKRVDLDLAGFESDIFSH